MTVLDDFRAEKDDFFASHPQSPLTRAQKQAFQGLHYFDENPALRFELKVTPFAEREEVSIQTSTGDVRIYTRFGRLTFMVDGQQAELTIYETDHGYFLPFVDSLAGTETYPAGRYLDLEQASGDLFVVDFNLAYNPYCAYNDAWSCPLTPFENRLKVPIRAGEKIFHTE